MDLYHAVVDVQGSMREGSFRRLPDFLNFRKPFVCPFTSNAGFILWNTRLLIYIVLPMKLLIQSLHTIMKEALN